MTTTTPVPVGIVTLGGDVNDSTTHDQVDRIIHRREMECLVMLNSSTMATPVSELYCPGTFDGWSCWPDTPAGTSVQVPCPEFITGFDPSRMAHKECNPNGTWYRHPTSGHVWSNYTTCINLDDLNWRQHVNRIYEIGYFISLLALLLSLFILYHFKHFRVESARFATRDTFCARSYLPVRFTVSSYVESLRCARTTLHMHLFASFAVNNALWLLWYRLVVNHPDAIMNNGVECQVLHVILHYFLLASYAWMLCEGFYLHTLLVNAFISESRLVRWLCVLGWTVPVLIIVVYTALRAAGPGKDTSECWINENRYSLVLAVPVCVSMVLNLGFLCNILRVLLVKLRAAPHVGSARPSSTLLQAVRATLLLVPLLGLNYLVTPFRPPPGHYYEKTYEVISATTASFQGLCVAIMFCFCNGEVVAQVKRKWQHLMFRPRANSCTATTVSVRQFVRSTNGPVTNEDNV
ncbi:calcitonin gene-related peptide type 1 receptor-like isoform X5 [Bacillus rossius redtenbacheri]|uniref:calcitonin gene-related peptide type 1 receptor-like isoform X5 n=1 Tax=Bacillus rossius redtenbacheri TaxID=93214 RepID=UPI002FDCE3B2